MKILAIDTSNQPLSVALLEDQKLLAETTTTVSKNHSATLMPAIDQIFKQSRLKPADIDRVVVAQGPGSYTGLRIGVTTAKTLAYSLDKELVGVSSLAVLAAAVHPNDDTILVPLFDARRQNVFAGAYQWQDSQLVNVLPDQHVSLNDLCQQLSGKKICLIGTAAQQFADEFAANLAADSYDFAPVETAIPRAFVLGLLGEDKQPENVNDFLPQYLRITQAEAQWLEKNPAGKENHGPYIQKY
ncbi:MAG TPA: tRNA (adenosine(37)-N6)-threonylcarbamoyltransferase complex dimerization subunit type 1 TsaB [Candidatus Ligilactobacillus excrementipullorum]|nr:tRNA (adenosine(37)-N6)-threonylcarbamoyltransferase complex dimerization subunit type 1 TsaB [Candidatus Ligilactobacillus excrementipullorum]